MDSKEIKMSPSLIEQIEQLCVPHIHTAPDGNQYVIGKNGSVKQIKPEKPEYFDVAETIILHSLDALVTMVKSEAAQIHKGLPIYIEAKSYNFVTCFLSVEADKGFMRQTLYSVTATDVPGWKEDGEMGYEQALIAVRTRFQQSPDTEYLLRLLSSISNKAKLTFADNGVATSIVSEKGIALQQSEPIRPIVTMRPYRTFQEIEQPLSEFHIRISERGIRFIEADGGMWKLDARKTIVAYLCEALAGLIDDGAVFVML
jgi:hypothetical protein